jgi:glucokinase
MGTGSTRNEPSTPTRYLGVDVGGTTVEAGLVTAAGSVLEVNAVESHIGGSREQVLNDIDAALVPLMSKSAVGLGIGFPSFGDYDQGILDAERSGFPAMHGFPLRRHLEETYGLSVKMVPDANLRAHGVLRFGEGRQFADFMVIGLGTGTAIGLVRNREVLAGPRGFPEPTMRFYTEWGWPAAWGHSGYYFADRYGADPQTTYRRAVAGDRVALSAFEQVGATLADTIIRLARETQISQAVVSGGLSNAWAFIEPTLQTRVAPLGISVMRTELAHPSIVGAVALFVE